MPAIWASASIAAKFAPINLLLLVPAAFMDWSTTARHCKEMFKLLAYRAPVKSLTERNLLWLRLCNSENLLNVALIFVGCSHNSQQFPVESHV